MFSENDVTIIAAILSLFISIVNAVCLIITNRKQIKTDVVSKNRQIWINEVRELVNSFLRIYFESDDKKQMKIIRNNIALYVRKDVSDYDELMKALDNCIKETYSNDNSELVIEKTQIMLNGVWIRIKREADITKKNDEYFKKLTNNN